MASEEIALPLGTRKLQVESMVNRRFAFSGSRPPLLHLSSFLQPTCRGEGLGGLFPPSFPDGHPGSSGPWPPNLAEMASIGLPVPPGFTISAEMCGRGPPDGPGIPLQSSLRMGSLLQSQDLHCFGLSSVTPVDPPWTPPPNQDCGPPWTTKYIVLEDVPYWRGGLGATLFGGEGRA